MEYLPIEVATYLAGFLNGNALCCMRCVSRWWYEVIAADTTLVQCAKVGVLNAQAATDWLVQAKWGFSGCDGEFRMALSLHDIDTHDDARGCHFGKEYRVLNRKCESIAIADIHMSRVGIRKIELNSNSIDKWSLDIYTTTPRCYVIHVGQSHAAFRLTTDKVAKTIVGGAPTFIAGGRDEKCRVILCFFRKVLFILMERW